MGYLFQILIQLISFEYSFQIFAQKTLDKMEVKCLWGLSFEYLHS